MVAEFMHRATTRNPSLSSSLIEMQRTFRHWVADVVAWCVSTDTPEAQKGPQVELVLGGIDQDLVRELPLQFNMNGAIVYINDSARPQFLNGAAYVIHELSLRFLPLEEETALRSLACLYGFSRFPGESIDGTLARFEIVSHRAANRGGVTLQDTQGAWMLLLALGYNEDVWVTLLAPTRGRLPSNAGKYQACLEYVKRHGRLRDAGDVLAINREASRSPVLATAGVEQWYDMMNSPLVAQGTCDGAGDFAGGGAASSSGCGDGCVGCGRGCLHFASSPVFPMELHDDPGTSDEEDHVWLYGPEAQDGAAETAWLAQKLPRVVGEYFYQQQKKYKATWRVVSASSCPPLSCAFSSP